MKLWKSAALSLLFVSSMASAETIPYKQAQKNGIVTCLPAVKNISEFLLGDHSNYGASSSWATENTDKQMFISRIEKTYKDGDSELMTMYVAPTTSGLCASAYEKVTYWPSSCMKVAKETFSTFEYKGELNEVITHLAKDGDPLFLMKAGNGCVSIKQERVNNGNNP
jgi:hypothetical protein